MIKKIQDLKLDGKGEKIDLKKKHVRAKLKKDKNIIYKKTTPIIEVIDIKGVKKNHYIYVKGRKFEPPKFLGNLLRIATVGFLIIILINAVNVYYTGKRLEKEISGHAYEGYSFLIDAGKNATKTQFNNAVVAFEKALENFSEAERALWFISTDKSFYANSDNVGQAANAILNGGKYFALSGEYFLDALEEFNKIPLYFVSKNANANLSPPSITDTLKLGLEKTDLAIEQISLAAQEMAKINEEKLPPEIAVRASFAKKKVEEVSEILNSTAKHFPAILKLLGDRYPHRYLILLQNNNEIRPSGGFIGSYIIMDVNEGYIEKLETNDVYDLDDPFRDYIEPPENLKEFIPNWRFRDANYSADFPTSASKLRWFLQKEGGPSVDTVIAINQGLLRDMLEITGPVQVGDFGKLNSENYNLLLSYVIEGKIWGKEDPKHILKVFVPAFKEAMLKEKNIGKIGSKIYKALLQKHIMMYSSDEEIEGLFDAFGISGRVHETRENEDYLSVINSSVGSNKSDQFVEENITHETFIDEHGNVTNEVTVKRSHNFDEDVLKYWKKILKNYGFEEMPSWLLDILGRGNNKVFMQIYVPADSILIESSDNNIETKYDAELKKTYFLTTLEVPNGQFREVKVKYRLPFAMNFNQPADTYKLIVEKQPGSRGSVFTKKIHVDEDLENLSYYPEDSRISSDGDIVYATNLVYDRYFSGIWSK